EKQGAAAQHGSSLSFTLLKLIISISSCRFKALAFSLQVSVTTSLNNNSRRSGLHRRPVGTKLWVVLKKIIDNIQGVDNMDYKEADGNACGMEGFGKKELVEIAQASLRVAPRSTNCSSP
ncbi:hypothetical protein LINPERHAP2_LOCUS35610, partial [Linum perenne]